MKASEVLYLNAFERPEKEFCSEPGTSKVRSLLTKNFAFSLESAIASLRGIGVGEGERRGNGAVWASSSETKLFSPLFVCTIEMHINKNLQGFF